MNNFIEQSALMAMQAMLSSSTSYDNEKLEWIVRQSFKIAKMMDKEKTKISHESYDVYTSPRR